MAILLLQDLLDSKKRKQKELAFYTEEKQKLERRLYHIRREIALTDKILGMIKREELIDLGKKL